MSAIGIGIIGSGNFARTHAEALSRIKGARVTAVLGSDKSRVDKISRKFAVKGYIDINDFLADPEIELVDVVNRHDMHAEAAVRSILAGKNVILEKPMATCLADADRIIGACNETKRQLSVISQHRYDQVYVRARKLVNSGALGKIISASILMRWCRPAQYYQGYRSWLGAPGTAGGGVLMMQAVHLIDIFTWILGPAASVRAQTDTFTHDIEVEDTVSALFTMKNGAQGLISATTSASRNLMDRLEIIGEKGSLIIEDHRYFRHIKPAGSKAGRLLERVGFKLSRLAPLNMEFKKADKTGGIGAQLADIVECCTRGDSLPSTPVEARHVLSVIFGIYESSKTGKEVLFQ